MIGECLGECGTSRAIGLSPAMGSSVLINDYDIFLRSQRVHDCGFWEGSDDVEIDGSPFSSVLSLALDGYGGATEIIELALGSSKLANVGGRG